MADHYKSAHGSRPSCQPTILEEDTENEVELVEVAYTFADQAISKKAPWFRTRFIVSFLMMLAMTVCFAMRAALSVAIVAMTDETSNPDFEVFDWSLSTQSTILSSFFWGYVITNVVGGMAIQKFGTRWILFSGVLVSSLATALVPVGASYGGWGVTCALRLIQGLAQGPLYAAMHSLLSKWALPEERGRLGAVVLSGSVAGTVIALAASGALASSSGGWPSIFYVFASIGGAWCIVWFFFGYSCPDDHPYVSESEKVLIESTYITEMVHSFYIPIRDIVKSLPVWGIVCASCVQCWGFYMLLTEMPTYINAILKFNIKDNGLLVSLPYLTMFFVTILCGLISDALTKRSIISPTVARKIFNSIGFLVPMAAMFGLSSVGYNEKDLAIALMVISATGNSGVCVGYQINHIDIAPNFAPILMGVTNAIGGIISAVVPLVVGAVVLDEKNEKQWQIMFYVTAGVYLFGAIAFALLASGEIQKWNEPNRRAEPDSGKSEPELT